MISLITHLKNFLVTELQKAIGSSSDQSLRVLFAAPTYEQLCKLYHELKSDDDSGSGSMVRIGQQQLA